MSLKERARGTRPATRALARFREAPSGVIDFDDVPHPRAADWANPYSVWAQGRLAFTADTKVHLVAVGEAVAGLAVKADHARRACRVRGWWQPSSESLRARAPQPIVHAARGLCHQASVVIVRLGKVKGIAARGARLEPQRKAIRAKRRSPLILEQRAASQRMRATRRTRCCCA